MFLELGGTATFDSEVAASLGISLSWALKAAAPIGSDRLRRIAARLVGISLCAVAGRMDNVAAQRDPSSMLSRRRPI